MSDLLEIETDAGVRTLTLNRPEQRNAFSVALYQRFAAALEEANEDRAIGALVVTGTGTTFCSGTDLGELAQVAAGNSPAGSAEAFPAVLNALMDLELPVIAAVNGPGVGLGFTMLSFCDLVFMADCARLKAPFLQMGVPPEAASSYMFPARMGWQRAARTLLLGEWLSAQDALSAGMATEVCPADEVLTRAHAAARQIAAAPNGAGRTTKRLMVAAERDAVHAANGREAQAYRTLYGRPV